MAVINTTNRGYPFPTSDEILSRSNDILWDAFNAIDVDINNLYLEKADLDDDTISITNTWSSYKIDQLLQSSALLTKIKEVDGVDSGLDADLYRGKQLHAIVQDVSSDISLDLNHNVNFILNFTSDSNVTFTNPDDFMEITIIIKPNGHNITLPTINWMNASPDFTKTKILIKLQYDGEEFIGLSYSK